MAQTFETEVTLFHHTLSHLQYDSSLHKQGPITTIEDQLRVVIHTMSITYENIDKTLRRFFDLTHSYPLGDPNIFGQYVDKLNRHISTTIAQHQEVVNSNPPSLFINSIGSFLLPLNLTNKTEHHT